MRRHKHKYAARALLRGHAESLEEEIENAGPAAKWLGLLLGDEMQAQVCAAGALLNILGPEAGANVNHPQRNALGRLISQTMTMAHAYAATTGEAFAPNASQAVSYTHLTLPTKA